MINETIDGIAAALKAEFKLPVLADDSEQDFLEPGFLIHPIQVSGQPFPCGQRKETQPFDILYFPAKGEDRTGLYDIAERAEQALRTISVGDAKIRAAKWSTQVIDGVLHCFANYDVFVDERKVLDNMMNMRSRQTTKKE
ncbi:MAG TPA: hypothetical protein DHW78_08365 [Ruminococcaceae bacterium]|jgi:hypothetical protein|nr:hypothetical protein [Oscillospiraceae bacterium]HCM24318.1 hypothetical protein [Oscillospiraceae bacterium]